MDFGEIFARNGCRGGRSDRRLHDAKHLSGFDQEISDRGSCNLDNGSYVPA
jgi:hypothetical protein